jgi:predicted transcriptional regulator
MEEQPPEDPQADLIEDLAIALLRGIHTIPELAKKLNADSNLIKSLLEKEFLEGKFVEKKIINGEDHYYLTLEGETEVNFITIARGEYIPELIDLEDSEIDDIKKEILLILENTSKEKPIDLFEKYFQLHPEIKPTYPTYGNAKGVFSRIHLLEDERYIEINSDEKYFITERGIKLLKKIREHRTTTQ